MKTNFFRSLSKNSTFKWISISEIKRLNRQAIVLFGYPDLRQDSDKFAARIVKLVTNNGFNFTFKYLKEIFRITVHALADSPTTPQGYWISLDKNHLPRFLPLSFRDILITRKDEVEIRQILSLIQVFRVMPTKVVPDLGSILDPFDGEIRIVNPTILSYIAKRLNFNPRFGAFRGFISEKAGPNGPKSTWFSAWDAFAFLNWPQFLYHWVILAIKTRSFGYLLWLAVILSQGTPFYLITLLTRQKKPSLMGKLGVVYDQAGKARVIAITNWWIQLALKPLHHSIFDWLKTLETDGTFNQEKPLNRQISMFPPGHTFYSFDLTSATDRIPKEVLVQILNIKGQGTLWINLIDLPWFYRGQFINYSVGQAMGAYSSWAMQATFNHFMVRYAAYRAFGKVGSTFSAYAVQGDDIVIADEKVGQEYRRLINQLGIPISEGKSIVSSRFCEFAKRLKGPGLDYTPQGCGALLQALRCKDQYVHLIGEAASIGIFPTSESVLSAGTRLGLDPLVQLLGTLNRNDDTSKEGNTGMNLDSIFSWTVEPDVLLLLQHASILAAAREKMAKSLSEAIKADELFCKEWFTRTSLDWAFLAVIEILLIIISPGFWLYYLDYPIRIGKLDEELKSLQKHQTYQWKTVRNLHRLHIVPPADISWRLKREILSYGRVTKHLIRSLRSEIRVHNESSDYWLTQDW